MSVSTSFSRMISPDTAWDARTTFQRGDHARLVAGLTRRLHHLGYEVTLRPAA